MNRHWLFACCVVLMNAVYWDTQRAPLGTDRAAHCAIWSTWRK